MAVHNQGIAPRDLTRMVQERLECVELSDADWKPLGLVAAARHVPRHDIIAVLVREAYAEHYPQWNARPGDGLPTFDEVWTLFRGVPPPQMTDEERAAFDEQLAEVDKRRREIYGEPPETDG